MNNFEMNMYLNNEVHGTRRKYTNTFILKDYQRLLCQYHSLQCSINCLQYLILI